MSGIAFRGGNQGEHPPMQGHKPTTTKARRFSTAQGPSNDGKQYIMLSASIQREGYAMWLREEQSVEHGAKMTSARNR